MFGSDIEKNEFEFFCPNYLTILQDLFKFSSTVCKSVAYAEFSAPIKLSYIFIVDILMTQSIIFFNRLYIAYTAVAAWNCTVVNLSWWSKNTCFENADARGSICLLLLVWQTHTLYIYYIFFRKTEYTAQQAKH